MELTNLYNTIQSRKTEKTEGSYTCYLFDKGLDKILKKIGEEAAETVIAAKNGEAVELTAELADLTYHMLVLMAHQNIPLHALTAELERRAAKTGNKKQEFQSDKNT
jgi:phosphoribosyl-ATP pyrophosphohydrolase